jgi:hypothetical protein
VRSITIAVALLLAGMFGALTTGQTQTARDVAAGPYTTWSMYLGGAHSAQY